MLSFDVANLSADGEEDNFTISLPNSVTVEEATVTNAGTLDPEDLNPKNPIEFSVNPESQIQDPVSMTVELQLSAGSD
jgi:hypothetical protein